MRKAPKEIHYWSIHLNIVDFHIKFHQETKEEEIFFLFPNKISDMTKNKREIEMKMDGKNHG